MNWVDYTIIAILVLGAISGLRKGLIMSISNIVCLLVSIIVAKTYYKALTVFLVENTPIAEKITGFLSDKAIANSILMSPMGESAVFSLSGSFIRDLNSFITVLIINAISILAIFLATRLVLSFAESFLTGVFNMPGLRELNSVGGAVIGTAKNIILLMLVFTVITPVSTIRSFSALGKGIEASVLAKYFYQYNFILGWIWSAALEILKK